VVSQDTALGTAMATGLVEALVTSADKNPGLWTELEKLFGPASLKHAVAWRDFGRWRRVVGALFMTQIEGSSSFESSLGDKHRICISSPPNAACAIRLGWLVHHRKQREEPIQVHSIKEVAWQAPGPSSPNCLPISV
jgi:hypothetical protein